MLRILADSMMIAVRGARYKDRSGSKQRQWHGPSHRDIERSFARDISEYTRRW